MNRAAVLARLAGHTPAAASVGALRPAAVVALLRARRDGDDELEVVLTRRARDLEEHAGQVAFPGGCIDPGDAGPEAAALRELQEELGVAPGAVEIVGRLDDLRTVTGFHITPVVGLLAPGSTFRPDPREVARVFTVPLARLLDERGWRLHERVWEGRLFESWHFPYDGEDIWGATAQMLRNLIGILSSRAAGTPVAGAKPGE